MCSKFHSTIAIKYLINVSTSTRSMGSENAGGCSRHRLRIESTFHKNRGQTKLNRMKFTFEIKILSFIALPHSPLLRDLNSIMCLGIDRSKIFKFL